MKKDCKDEIQILFLVLPYSNVLDFAGAIQVFHEAADNGLNVRLKFCRYNEQVETSVGLPLGKIENYSEQILQEGDYVFIVSANMGYVLSGKMNPGRQFSDWIINAHNSGANICAICNAAFLLGDAGMLDYRECTTHWKRTAEMQKRFPRAKVQENLLFVEDDRIITSAGMASGIDVALFVLGKLRDDHFVYKISKELVLYNRRSGSNHQLSVYLNYRSHVHEGIHRVQDWLIDNLDKRTSIPDLAEMALMSVRNFTRVFKKETQVTVNEYINLLRVEKIKSYLMTPDMPRDQIAKLCGLKSHRQIGRLINKMQ